MHEVKVKAEYFNTTNMALGLSHIEHFKRMNNYLEKHPKEDISDTNAPFYTMDNITAPTYFVGMIVCNWVLKQGRTELLKKGLNAGMKDEDIKRFIETEIRIKGRNINTELRKEIHRLSSMGFERSLLL